MFNQTTVAFFDFVPEHLEFQWSAVDFDVVFSIAYTPGNIFDNGVYRVLRCLSMTTYTHGMVRPWNAAANEIYTMYFIVRKTEPYSRIIISLEDEDTTLAADIIQLFRDIGEYERVARWLNV